MHLLRRALFIMRRNAIWFSEACSATPNTLIIFLTIFSFWSVQVSAADNATPLTTSGVTIVEAKSVAAMLGESKAQLIDTRSLHDYLVGHLPNARHVDYPEHSARIPDFNANQDDVPAFIARLRKFATPDQPIILYCNGVTCWKSYKAAIAAHKNGYHSIYWFRGGILEWQKSGNSLVVEFED